MVMTECHASAEWATANDHEVQFGVETLINVNVFI